jgi:hypothetical protein
LLQLEALEKTIGQQQRELKRLNEQSIQQAEVSSQMKHDLETRLDRVRSLRNLKELISCRTVHYINKCIYSCL